MVAPSRFGLDDARQMSDLKALGINCARTEEKRARPRFLDRMAVPFVPTHTPHDNGDPERAPQIFARVVNEPCRPSLPEAG
jgi:hypothetical protein